MSLRNLLALSCLLTAICYTADLHAEDVVVLTYSAPGTYYVQVSVDDDGRASVKQINSVTALKDPSGGSDDGGVFPEPPVVPSTELSETVREAAAAVDRPKVSMAMSGVYANVAEKLKSGEIQSDNTALSIIRELTEVVLTSQDAVDSFQPVRDIITQEFTSLNKDGELDLKRHLPEVAEGFRLAAGDGESVFTFNVATIVRLVKIVVEARNRGEVLTLDTLLEILEALGGF